MNMLNSKILKVCFADFESILIPEDNGKQNLEESYTNKYQKHVAWMYGYISACVDDKFSKPFKSYLGEDAVYNLFIVCPKKINIVMML